MENLTVYDLETPANLFTAGFKDVATGKKKAFVIHESRNDFHKLIRFLEAIRINTYTLVGYNCLQFDAQILQYLLNNYQVLSEWDGDALARKIHELSQKIIALPDDEKFKQLIPEWKLNIPHIDIYKQCHFDGKAKRTSLKWLQFTMRFPNIESMPIHHTDEVGADTIPLVLGYMGNDIDATAEFFSRIKFETELRETLSKEYGKNLINASEPRLAREIFGKILGEAMGLEYRDLKEKRTYRNRIYVKDIIFPYVRFKDKILNGVLDFYKGLDFDPYNFESNNLNLKHVEKVFRWENIPEVVVGLGGIHGCVNPGVYKSRPDLLMEDIDVTSYYPNLGIKNKLFPEHLSDIFCDVYEDLFNARQRIDKKSPINYIYKIILNSAYGLSKEMNNYFHDPKYTFSITINGQLLILMLAQRLKEKIPGIMFYQLNTDGVTVGYHPRYKDDVAKVKEEWQKLTMLKLENNFYKMMVIKDVNNYLALDEKGKVKRKGLFGYSLDPEDKEMAYHKNPSELIVPKALEQYFVHGVDYEKYIMESTDIYDFCSGVKVKRDFDLYRHWYDKETSSIHKEQIKQQVCRYYVSNETSTLKKRYKEHAKTPGRVIELKKGCNLTYFNTYVKKDMKDYDLNYSHYISAVRSIIAEITPNASQAALIFE